MRPQKVCAGLPQNTRQCHSSLALILSRRDKLEESERVYRRTLEVARRVFGNEHHRVATILNNLGLVYLQTGNHSASEAVFREALALLLTRFGEGQWETGDTRSNLGECLTKLGRYPEAERELLAAHRVMVAGLGYGHWRTTRALHRLEALYEAWGKPEKWAALRRRAQPSDNPAHESRAKP